MTETDQPYGTASWQARCYDAKDRLADIERQAIWQPIETAPKDGAVVLLRVPDPDVEYALGFWDDGWIDFAKVDHDDVRRIRSEGREAPFVFGTPTYWLAFIDAPDDSGEGALEAELEQVCVLASAGYKDALCARTECQYGGECVGRCGNPRRHPRTICDEVRTALREPRVPAPTDNGIPELDSLCEQYNDGEIDLCALVCRAWNKALAQSDQGRVPEAVNVVFDGPPGPNPPHFVEVETDDGRSVRVGAWIERNDGMWALRIARASGEGR